MEIVFSGPKSGFIGVPLQAGFFDYNDLATATTPIVVTGGAGPIPLTNDGLGPFTNKTYAPSGVTDVWDASTGTFDWSELNLGDQVDIRIDLEVDTASPNQEILVDLNLAQSPGFTYDIPFEDIVEKSSGTHLINRYNGIYMGDANTRDNPGQFTIESDGNCTVIVRGWYCRITRSG